MGVIPLPTVDEDTLLGGNQNHKPPSTGIPNEVAEVVTCLAATKPNNIEYENQTGVKNFVYLADGRALN